MVRDVMNKKLAVGAAGLIALAVTVAGCGGGGGGGGGGGSVDGKILSVSFIGFQPGPGQPAPPIPAVFRDQTIEFTFDGDLDDGVFGGFYAQGGIPVVFNGVPPAGTQQIPYYAFVNQSAARSSLQVRLNEAGGALLEPYIVGRHRDKPNVIVVDPRIQVTNPFGYQASPGFQANKVYIYHIPANNGFSFEGKVAQTVGPTVVTLPLPIPPFTSQPNLSVLFSASSAFGPDPIPATVLSIEALSGHAGTPADPTVSLEIFVITFSKSVSFSSFDQQRNFIVRNLDFTNPSFPEGIIVPGTIMPVTPGLVDDAVYHFVPAAEFGPGISPTEGFDIEVRIGSFDDPNIPPITGLPTGISATALPIGNSMARTFRTTPCLSCQTLASIIEGFEDTTMRDPTGTPTSWQTFPNSGAVAKFQPQQVRWNDATALGQLAGRPLSGSAAGNNDIALGSRHQVIVNPPPPLGAGGMFSPFDASLAQSGTQCPNGPTLPPTPLVGCNQNGQNPDGGCHIMHVYPSSELQTLEESLEQIEWNPVSNVTIATAYPQYQIWCGVSKALWTGDATQAQGLLGSMWAHYTHLPYQTGVLIPAPCQPPGMTNAEQVPCGGPMTYQVPVMATQFFPYPILDPPFDFSTRTGQSGVGSGSVPAVNLVFEQNIEPGPQKPNFHVFSSTQLSPVRRSVDLPLSMLVGNCPQNAFGQLDVYRLRFTFVNVVGQARSLWYDTSVADPDYTNYIINFATGAFPPAGATVRWDIEGTDQLNPTPATNGTVKNYLDEQNVFHFGALNEIAPNGIHQLRYFRFKVEFRGNPKNNAIPVVNSWIMAYTG